MLITIEEHNRVVAGLTQELDLMCRQLKEKEAQLKKKEDSLTFQRQTTNIANFELVRLQQELYAYTQLLEKQSGKKSKIPKALRELIDKARESTNNYFGNDRNQQKDTTDNSSCQVQEKMQSLKRDFSNKF